MLFILETALRRGKVRDRVPMRFVPSEPTIGRLGLDDTSAPVRLWNGVRDVTRVTFRDLGAAFSVAMIPVPLLLIGILFGQGLFGVPFSAIAMNGCIALAGIIPRRSVLLVDLIRHSGAARPALIGVVLEAGSIRFKPTLLTLLAAMIGAVTILADPIFQGLAISLLFGLFSSPILTVLVIPAIDFALRGGHRPADPEVST